MPTIETNGIQTYYEEYGDGPPIVFLHGAGSDHRLWAEQTRPLTDDYRVIVYDLRGHGRTGGSEISSYSMDLYAEDLRSLIAGLDLDRPAICGLSMGGMIAQRYVANYTDSIVAFCTVGASTPEILSRGEWFQHRVVLNTIETLSDVVNPDRILSVIRWINERIYGENASGDLEKGERIQQNHAEEFPEMTETEIEKMRAALTSYTEISIDYSSITVPTLLMYGEHEPRSMARHAEYMANVIPTAEARQIPNAGHNSHVDNPEFIVETLREFLTPALERQHESAQSRE